MWSTSSRMRNRALGAEPLDVLPEQPHRERVHRVADVDGERGAELPVQRGTASPRLAAVLDVVVHEERVVQHLDARRGGRGRRRPAAECPADWPDRARAEGLCSVARRTCAEGSVEVLPGFGRGTASSHRRQRPRAVPGEALGEAAGPSRDVARRRSGAPVSASRLPAERGRLRLPSRTGTLPSSSSRTPQLLPDLLGKVIGRLERRRGPVQLVESTLQPLRVEVSSR